MIISSYLQLSCPCCSPASSLSSTWDCFNRGGLKHSVMAGRLHRVSPHSLALATSSPCRTAMINWKALGLKYESFRWLVRAIISSQLHMTLWSTLGSHWNSFIFNATGISLALYNRVRPITRCRFCLGWACLDIRQLPLLTRQCSKIIVCFTKSKWAVMSLNGHFLSTLHCLFVIS